MKKIRTFIAVELSADVRDRALDLIERLRPAGARVNWVRDENMHVTLKFLGDVPNVDTPRVCSAVARAAAHVAPFELECFGAGAFPDARRARTLWIGARGGSREISALQAAVDAELKTEGFPQEHRRFHAHLTIGRVRLGGAAQRALGEIIEQNAAFEAGACTIGEALVIASYLDKSGPTYDVMSRAPLSA